MRSSAGVIALLLGTLLGAGTALAQKAMTVEELEAFLEQRKSELEAVEKNRQETEKKAEQVREELDAREAALRELEAELESLCKDREAVEAGSFDRCMAANGE